MPERQIDVIVRLMSDLSARDRAKIQRELNRVGTAGRAAGREIGRGMEEGRRETERTVETVLELGAALQRFNEYARQVGALGYLGAQQRDLAEGYDYLADRAGLSGGKLVAAMQKAAKGTVDANAIMRASNMVLGAQFEVTTNDMTKMMEFARLKSKQYSLSVEAAFTRMVFGAVKAEVEFLDELGITIRLNDALKLYADSLGVATNALTSKQRAMAIWKAILLDADQQLTEYGGTVTKATDWYEQLDVKILSATQAVQKFIDSSGVGPILFTASKAIDLLVPLLSQYVLMKNLAAASALRNAAAVTTETTAIVAQASAYDIAVKRRMAEYVTRPVAEATISSRLLAKGAGIATAIKSAAPTLVAGGLVAGGTIVAIKSYEKLKKIQQEVSTETEKTTDRWSKWTVKVKESVGTGEDAIDVARRYISKRQEVADVLYKDGNALQDLGYWMARNHIDEEKVINAREEEIEQLVRLTSKSYPEYKAALDEINAAQTKHAKLIKALSEREYDILQLEIDTTSEKLRYNAEQLEKVARAQGDMTGINAQAAMQMRKQADDLDALAEKQERDNKAKMEEAQVLSLVSGALRNAGLEGEALREKEDALALALGKTTPEALANRDAMEYLTQAYAEGRITEERLTEGILQSAAGLVEITKEERKQIETARALEKVWRDMVALQNERTANRLQTHFLQRKLAADEVRIEQESAVRVAELRRQSRTEGRRAYTDYIKSVEQAAHQHARRVESIERRHRMTLQDIERRFSKTVRKAAIERDALTILEAKEARAEEIDDAGRSRSESLRQENENYQDQLRALADSYQDRLREIAAALVEEVRREREANTLKLADNRSYYAQQLAEFRAFNASMETEAMRNRIRMRDLQRGFRGSGGGGGATGGAGGTVFMQHGGAGFVTGPATFKVEPGMTEAYWFSGAMGGGRSSPVPGGATQARQVMIGGSVDVNVNGLGERVSARVVPQIGQLIADVLAEAFEAV